MRKWSRGPSLEISTQVEIQLNMNSVNLNENEYAPFYSGYVKGLGAVNLIDILETSEKEVVDAINNLPKEKYEYRYAEGKWTIKELLLHVIDTERVFSYRALRFARKDTTDLPGFDENWYVDNSFGNSRTIEDLLREYSEVRAATLRLFKSFSDETLMVSGTASNNPMSVRALGFIIAGHALHHLKIIQERYL